MAINMDVLDRGKQLLVMTVDIGDGRQDFITVYENDDPVQLSQEFAVKYGLSLTLQKNLSVMIRENTKEVLKNNLHLREQSDSEVIEDTPYLSPVKTGNVYSQSRTITRQMSPTKAESKPTEKGSVYGAVYKQLKKSSTSKSITMHSSLNKIQKSTSGFNYGDYLYAKGLKDKEQAEKFKEMKKQEQFINEMHHFTFSPLINTNSSILSPRSYDKPENILLQKKQEKEEKIKKLKEEVEKEQYKDCYFTPKINKISKNRETNGKIHESLHNQAEERKQKREQKIEQEIKQIPFKPDVKTARKKNVFETKDQLFDRLESSKKVIEEDMDKKRKVLEENDTDQVTGQKLYRPLTSMNSEKAISRYNSEPIWNYLYSQKDSKKKESDSSQQEFLKHLDSLSKSKKTSEKSDKIFNDFRTKQFENLFLVMDSDRDGSISARNINITDLNVDLLKVLTEFFEELEKSKKTMDLAEFCEKMEELYKVLNVEQKAVLIKRLEKKIQEEEKERRPFISSNSMSLAEKKRSSLPADFFERQSTVTKMTEMRLEKIREEKGEKLQKQCTFKPELKVN